MRQRGTIMKTKNKQKIRRVLAGCAVVLGVLCEASCTIISLPKDSKTQIAVETTPAGAE